MKGYKNPIDDWSKLDTYSPPDPEKIIATDITSMNKKLEKYGHTKFVFSMSDISLF